MTIVAGFSVKDGILLCSDSQFTSWEKSYKKKLFFYPFEAVTVSFAFAGDDDYGRSIIEDCREAIALIPSSEQALWNVRKTIRRAINRGLKECSAGIEKPEFLICMSTSADGSILFSNREAAMPRVDTFDFRGTGSYIGHYVMKSFDPLGTGLSLMTLEEAVLLGLCVLSAAKRHDANCGGGSQFLAIKSTGIFHYGAAPLDLFGNYMDRYESLMRSLLMSVGEVDLSDEEFLKRLSDFNRAVSDMRSKMCSLGCAYRMLLDSLREVGKQDLQSPTPDPKFPPSGGV